jgi:hypothetical protein
MSDSDQDIIYLDDIKIEGDEKVKITIKSFNGAT